MSDQSTRIPSDKPELAMLEALQRLRAGIDLVARGSALPDRFALPKVLEKIGAAERPVAQPQIAILERVRTNILLAAAKGDVKGADPRDLREAPWLLWTETQPLSAVPGLLDAVHQLATRSAGVRRNLIEAWIAAGTSNAPGLDAAGQGILRLVSESTDLRLAVWRKAAQEFKLFDRVAGPKSVARAILEWQEPVADILSHAGLDTPLRAVGGYARLVQASLLEQLPGFLSGRQAERPLARAVSFLLHEDKLRFDEPDARGALADALIAPWRSGAMPQPSIQGEVQKLLLRYLGDPRTKPARWNTADKATIATMRGWLSRASLVAFFDVIADHADENFRYRRAFWTAYLNANAIQDAWIALGRDAHATARGIKDLDGAYARLWGVGGDQSVLLFKIGNDIFCEWSHSGSLRAWPDDWKNAPVLYRGQYERVDLFGLCLPFPPSAHSGSKGAPNGKGLHHRASDKSNWQSSAAELIARRSKIRLVAKDWMPR